MVVFPLMLWYLWLLIFCVASLLPPQTPILYFLENSDMICRHLALTAIAWDQGYIQYTAFSPQHTQRHRVAFS